MPADPGHICGWCDEPITGNPSLLIRGGYFHDECAVRSMAGSVGHQLRRCSCYGGNQEDPTGQTKREAARAAWMIFAMHQRVVTMAEEFLIPEDA